MRRKNKEKYNKALEGYYTKNPDQVLNAKKLFEELSDYKDAALLASKCDKKVIDLQNKKKRNKKIKIIVSVSLLLIIIVIVGLVFLINKVLIPNSKLNEAKGLAKEMHYSVIMVSNILIAFNIPLASPSLSTVTT